ncbi:hypothetical protein [Ferrimonas lipolytica]|uniref:Uncharacterized protein n=1 Tax=Ferrimonas lipolytica TaxID=2724191 RepID=A0A6H1UKQ4_9GAMM|nr:hypothetical protein [Ferrimonas lipolytica]QIZ78382.1 hypothetical protein HER31_16620 [Ferrimonas lipolytica]
MMWRLALVLSISTSVDALELGGTEVMPTLTDRACSYGRGSQAVEAAKQQWQQQIKQQLSQQSLNELGLKNLKLGLEQQQFQFEPAQVSGNDTCIKGTLTAMQSHADDQWAVDWDDDVPEVHSVTVVGEGWPKGELTARQAAENDALTRAVRQVVGVLVNSQQYSQGGVVEQQRFADAAATMLITQSQGFVKQWQQLAQRPLDNQGLELTAQVQVTALNMSEQIDRIVMMLGSPSVYINCEQQWLKSELSDRLLNWGMASVLTPDAADLILDVTSAIHNVKPDTAQLRLDIGLRDLWGQQFAQWSNEPELLTLPVGMPNLERELLQAHTSLPKNQTTIRQSLLDAMMHQVQLGGPQRQIQVPSALLARAELQQRLQQVPGVTLVSLQTDADQHLVQLRFMGSITDLMNYLTLKLKQETVSLHAQDANHIVVQRL